MPEIRFEATSEEVAVLDGYCSATGKDRTKIMKELLRQWSESKVHEATLICRVAGVNPTAPDAVRKGGRE